MTKQTMHYMTFRYKFKYLVGHPLDGPLALKVPSYARYVLLSLAVILDCSVFRLSRLLYSAKTAKGALVEVLKTIQAITPATLVKVKNELEAALVFDQVSLIHRAQELAAATLEGDTYLVNKKFEYIQAVNLAAVQAAAEMILQEENCTTLHYQTIR